jgi:hypothetical protein
MTIQLNLPTEIEAELSQLNKGSKQAIKSYIIDAIKHKLQNKRIQCSEQETILLKKISLGFSDIFWTRYHELIQKKETEIITQLELSEIIEMTQQIESADAMRLEAIVQLAILQNKKPKDLMREMGLFQEKSYGN